MISVRVYIISRNISFTLLCCVLLFACAHTPQPIINEKQAHTQNTTNNTTGDQIAEIANSLLGSPYRYGGASPKGFDCSGLVYYTHGKLGIRTPRTSLQQYKNAKQIKFSELTAGDLVFFKLNRIKVSHVGIYVGNGQFIHAPKKGKNVSVSSLNDPFWSKRTFRAGRLY